MIKINLLPEKKPKEEDVKASPAKSFLTLIGGITLAVLLVMGGISYYFASYEKSNLLKQSENNKNQITQLQKKIQDVKKFEALNASIQLKTTLIENLRKHQAVPVRILDEVSSVLPEGVWLTSLTYKDNIVKIEGVAYTNLDIVSYVENFKKSAIITEVSLDESKYDEIDKIQVYKFKLNFRVKDS
jgi:type IV pilus assembly protein PilN